MEQLTKKQIKKLLNKQIKKFVKIEIFFLSIELKQYQFLIDLINSKIDFIELFEIDLKKFDKYCFNNQLTNLTINNFLMENNFQLKNYY